MVGRSIVGEPMSVLGGVGRWMMAAAIAGFGVVVIAFGDLALFWDGKTVAHQALLADAGGLLLLLLGAGLLIRGRLARDAPAALALLLALKIAVVCLPALVRQPTNFLAWYAPAEPLAMAAGALALWRRGGDRDRPARLARYAFGLALIPIGVSHFVYSGLTAGLVPPWLPDRPAWAAVTGACHLAAGAAILTGVVAPSAAWLEAAMMSLFTLLVWVPAVATKPGAAENWSELCLSAALSGAAFALAASSSLRRGGRLAAACRAV